MSKFYQKQIDPCLDHLCSALAFNCCQFGCCIPSVPLVPYTYDNSDWIAKLTEDAPTLKLRDTILPGTHDSASYTIGKGKLFSAVGRTQNESLSGQMNRGARYLDIRVGGKGTDKEGVYIYHGFLTGKKFDTCLDEVAAFLEENPGEFIVLEIVQEYGRDMTPEQKLYTLDLVKSKLGDKAITDEDKKSWFNISKVTLGDIAEQKKNVFVLLHGRIFNDFENDGVTYSREHVAENYGFYKNSTVMRNKWHNTRDLGKLLESNTTDLKEHGSNRNSLYNNSFVLTPGVGGAGDVFRLLIGTQSLRPVTFARKLYKREVIDDYIRDKANDSWNMVTFDFIDLCPALVCFLIGLNFPFGLTITEATATPLAGEGDSVDVTEKIAKFLKRGKALYLTNIREDLELNFAEGTLQVSAKFEKDGEVKQHSIDFDEDTEYLLSHYSHNEGVMTKVE